MHSLCKLAAAVAVCFATVAAGAQDKSTCADVSTGDHPKALLSNGTLDALVFLPDAKTGYYHGARFDWSGVVGCVSLHGHHFFGGWGTPSDPLTHGGTTGPVEEFRTDGGVFGYNGPTPGALFIQPGAIGYNEAKPGELFLKPGVGILRKVDDAPYSYGFAYPIVDGGKWTVRVKPRSVTFRQVLQGPDGYAYVYEKILMLDKDRPILTLRHTFKNTGRKLIDTNVYDHDFYAFDGNLTGPGMVVHFAFEPKMAEPLDAAAKIEGKDLVYVDTLKPKQLADGYLTGYSQAASDYHFIVEDTNAKMGVEQTADTPLSRLYFWSTRNTICPEGYIHLNVPPARTSHWQIQYRFYAPVGQ